MDSVVSTGHENTSPEADAHAIRNRLVQAYIAQLPTTLLGIGVLLILNYSYYGDYLPSSIMRLWLATMMAGLIVYTTIVLVHRSNPQLCMNQSCIYWMAGASLLLGSGWGSMSIYAVENLGTDHSYLAIILAAGVVGAATSTNAALPITFKALALSSLAPLIAVMLMNERSSYQITGVTCLVYLVVMLKAIDQIHRTLRQSISLELKNSALIRILEEQSTTDVLTGLMNRRALNHGFDAAWERGLVDQTSVGLVLCDVDFFKAYNDSLGHQAGDECLAQIGLALKNSMRSSEDIVARYGGEEFAVLVRHSNPEILQQVAERIRVLIQNLRIPHPASKVARHVTISVGGSQIVPTRHSKIELLLNCADNALYSAKARGRNRTCLMIAEPASQPASAEVGNAASVVNLQHTN